MYYVGNKKYAIKKLQRIHNRRKKTKKRREMRKNLFFLFLCMGTIEYLLIRFFLTTPMLD